MGILNNNQLPPNARPEASAEELYVAADVQEETPPEDPDNPETGKQSAEHLADPYMYYQFKNRWTYNSGKEQIPVAAATGAARIVQLHAPCQLRICTWEVKRRGAQPNLPSPVGRDDNETLLTAEIESDGTGLDDDVSTKIYIFRGVYVFALAEPVWSPDALDLPIGVMPWTTLEIADEILDGGQFIEGMI